MRFSFRNRYSIGSIASGYGAIVLLSCLLMSSGRALAADDDFGAGLSVGVEHRLAKGLKVQAEAEVRTQDGLGSLERWALDLGLGYKVNDFLKADAGYVLMDRYRLSQTTSKGNIVSGFWSPRHRLYFGLTGQKEWGRFKFSLRERYQYTHAPLQYVPKHVGVHCDCATDHFGTRLTDEVEGGDDEHILRSRLQVSYNIRHCKFTPSGSIEFLNDLGNSLSLDQIRYSLNLDYSISKRKSLSLTWRFKDRSDSDESNGHFLGFGYNFTF